MFFNTCVPKVDGKTVTKFPLFRTGNSNSILYDILNVFQLKEI